MAATNHPLTIDSTNSITSVKSFSKSPVSQFYRVSTLLLLAAFSTCNNRYIPLRIQPSWSFSLKHNVINRKFGGMGCKLRSFLERSHRFIQLKNHHLFPNKLSYGSSTLTPLNVRKKHDQSNCSDNGPNQMMKPANANTNKNNKIKKYTKSNLPSKICCVCKRPFEWRKKWARVWDEVKYCSERCRRSSSPGNDTVD
jgi:hypothetical protein